MASHCAQAANALAIGCPLLFIAGKSSDVAETTFIEIQVSNSASSLELDGVLSPSCLSARDVEIIPSASRVLAGQAAVFTLVQIGANPQLKHHASVLTALASVTQVAATMHIAGADCAVQMPVDIEASVTLGCVLLIVTLPPGTPDGTIVAIGRVWVAGCVVGLNDLSSNITVGFNHAPASEGCVFEAAEHGDECGLVAALQNGGSTEEAG